MIVNDEDVEEITPTPTPDLTSDLSTDEASASQKGKDSWESAIATYEAEIRALGSQPAAATLLVEVGRIWEEHLGRPRNAALCYERALHMNGNDLAVLHAARRLATESGRWPEVVQHVSVEIGATNDPVRKAALLAEKAAILEERLDRADDARKAYREALEICPAERFAVHSLERMRVPARDVQGLFEVYLRASDAIDDPPHRVPLILAAARLAEESLQDIAAAVREYHRVLDVDGKNERALGALRRLHRASEEHVALADVLRRSARATDAPQAAARHLIAAARVEREALKDPDRALRSLLEALEQTPDDLFILSEVESLCDETKNYEEVARSLERQSKLLASPTERVVVLHRLGSVLEEHLDRADDAIPILVQAVELVPDYLPAVQSLGRLYQRSDRYEELAELFVQELERESDTGHRVTRLFKLAELYETRLGREVDAIKSLTQLLELQASYAPALEALERLYKQQSKWEALVALHEKQVELTEDREQRVFRLQQIGQLCEDELNAADRALAAYRKIVELVPGHLDAIRMLARLSEKKEDWEEVIRAHDLEVAATKNRAEVVSIMHRIGLVHEERRGDVDAAIASYEKVLSLAPSFLPALRSLGRLYRDQGRWADLVGMYRKELGVSQSDTQSMSLLFRMADVMVERIRDDDAAVEIYEEILGRQPDSAAALDALAEIHTRQSDHEKLVKVLLRAAPTMTSKSKETKTRLWVAELYERNLEEPERAAEIYRDLLRGGDEAEMAIDGLERIYAGSGRHGEFVEVLEQAAQTITDPASKALSLCRAARVLQGKMKKSDRAVELLLNAQKIAPKDPAVLLQLEHVLIMREDWPRVILVSEQLAELDRDPATYAARHLRIATIKECEFDPPKTAEANYANVLDRLPGHPVAMRGLELEFRRSQAWDRLMDLYHSEALHTKETSKKASLMFRAGELAEHRLGNEPIADARYKDALELSPTHLPALLGRRRVAERAENDEALLELILREHEIVADESRKTELLLEAGVINEDRFEELDRAEEYFRAVLDRVPGHPDAFARLRTRYERETDSASLIALLRKQASAVHDSAEQSQLLLDAALVAEEVMKDTTIASALYEEVLERSPQNELALTRLGPILVELEDWDDAKNVFLRVVDVSKDKAVLSNAFRSLGIIYQEQQEDLARSVEAFEKAIVANPEDTESLERAAQIYKQTEDWTASIRALSRLADIAQEPDKRVATLLELGRIYESGLADMSQAIQAHESALSADPTNRLALVRLADLYEKVERWDATAQTLERVTRTFENEEQAHAVPYRVRLAKVLEQHLGDDDRAATELSLVLEVERENVEALTALARLYSRNASTFQNALDVHNRLLRVAPFRVGSYREMRRMYDALDRPDRAYVMSEILVFLRSQDTEEEMFYLEYKDQIPPHASSRLSARDHYDYVLHADEQTPARAILEILGREASAIVPSSLEAFDLKRSDRHTARSQLPLRKFVEELGDVLGDVHFDLWTSSSLKREVRVAVGAPTALIVGEEVPRRVQEKEQRFLFGRAIEQIIGGHQLFTLSDEELDVLVCAAARMAEPRLRLRHRAERLDETERQLTKALSRSAKKALEQLSIAGQSFDFDAPTYRRAAAHTANRAGLVCANDVEVAIRTLARECGAKRTVFKNAEAAEQNIGQFGDVRDLLAYAGSHEYATVRERLGFTIL